MYRQMHSAVPLQFVVIVVLATWASRSWGGDGPQPLAVDPHQVLGHEKCMKCHQAEVDVWSKTPHAQTFESLHRKPAAQEIAGRLGLNSVKRNDVCIQCHYTMQQT